MFIIFHFLVAEMASLNPLGWNHYGDVDVYSQPFPGVGARARDVSQRNIGISDLR